MKRIDCAQLVDVAPELAAGNLCGEERAAAINHLATCASCQDEVNSLTLLTDRLLLLAPSVEPPAGFEQRVLEALPAEPARAHRHQHRSHKAALLLAAAVVLVLSCGAGGLLFDLAASREPVAVAADMRTPSGVVVGQVHLHDGSPPWMLMRLPGWTESHEGEEREAYAVHVETSSGHVTSYPISYRDNFSWSAPLDVDLDTIITIAIVDGDGAMSCQARFTST